MIDRYSTAEMRRVWSLQRKFEIWRDVEIAACEYWQTIGRISAEEMNDIRHKSTFTVERVTEIENEVHHDMIAFLTNLAENIGPASRHVHFGLTSSDVVDTAQMLQIQDAGGLILVALSTLLKSLRSQADRYKDLIVAGRTHGVHAEPTTLGLKLLGYYTELKRGEVRLKSALEECRVGKISGAVGTYSQVPLEMETFVLKKLHLEVEPVSTQVIPRDRHATFLHAIALIGQGLYRLMQEIRLLQRTESREVEEPFQKGQKGSSAMPHKRNPILAERICGLARVLSGYANTADYNIALWNERDISHSGAERVILPDSTALLEYMLQKSTFIVSNLHVHEKNCERVLNATSGLLFSSRALLKITESTQMSREDAYAIVQSYAMQVWDNPVHLSLRGLLEKDDKLAKISTREWDEVFSAKSFVEKIGAIFERVK